MRGPWHKVQRILCGFPQGPRARKRSSSIDPDKSCYRTPAARFQGQSTCTVTVSILFDRYGCIRCGRKKVVYCCGGLCKRCVGFINNRLKSSDRIMRRQYDMRKELPCEMFLKRLKSARELLADFR